MGTECTRLAPIFESLLFRPARLVNYFDTSFVILSEAKDLMSFVRSEPW